MAASGPVIAARPMLVSLSVRVTGAQGYWLDCMARRMGRSTGECLRALLDQLMAIEEAAHHRTQQAESPASSDKAR